jgi:CRISPR-associated protein (TIGR02584 family)
MKLDHILLAVTGMSPPIITETVWALAHEEPPVIPLRVVVVTTQAGAKAVSQELFTPARHGAADTVWERLRHQLKAEGYDVSGRLQFGTTGDDLRVFTVPDPDSAQSCQLTDIRSPADNRAAADFLLDQLRQFTENPDLTIIASVAGGRKTMSASFMPGFLCWGALTIG